MFKYFKNIEVIPLFIFPNNGKPIYNTLNTFYELVKPNWSIISPCFILPSTTGWEWELFVVFQFLFFCILLNNYITERLDYFIKII